jgi:flagellar basal-body rod protein FlgB
MYIFDVTAQQGRWLAVKQATIATNVANANTPGYKAQEVRAFDEVLDRTRLTLASTHAGHLDTGGADVRSAVTKAADPWDVSHSGNSVSLEQEMLKASEVNRSYALNTSIVKAFHRMYLASAKG